LSLTRILENYTCRSFFLNFAEYDLTVKTNVLLLDSSLITRLVLEDQARKGLFDSIAGVSLWSFGRRDLSSVP
jgi:hypothetical protein